MDLIRLEQSDLPTLELGKIAIFDFVYTLASANIDQITLNFVIIYMTIGSQISSITDPIELEKSNVYTVNRYQLSLILCLIGLERPLPLNKK